MSRELPRERVHAIEKEVAGNAYLLGNRCENLEELLWVIGRVLSGYERKGRDGE